MAIRLREPEQPDVIRRRLFTISYHLYAAPAYIKEHGQPQDARGPRPPSPAQPERRRALSR